MSFSFDTDLLSLTEEQLQEFLQQCWDTAGEITTEQERRRSLPWVWANETQIVKSLRTALGTAPKQGAKWVKPANFTMAYIDGDTVTHDDALWVATGEGAIMFAPGVTDPVMGQRWHKQDQQPDVE